MINTRPLTKAALGFALVGAMGIADAKMTQVKFDETALTLAAEWTLDSLAGSNSVSHGGTYWEVHLGGNIYDSVPFGAGTISFDQVTVQAQHTDSLHEPPGPVFTKTLGVFFDSTASYTAMAPHASGAAWTSPANWTNQHWDHYELKVAAAADGTAHVFLNAIHPVPEPESYAMMLAGLGLVGMIARRRRFQIG